MRKDVIGTAGLLAFAVAHAANASVVTLDLTVNGGTGPISVAPDELVTLNLYATVTGNRFNNSIDFGLAGYYVDIVASNGNLRPVQGTTLFGDPDGQWNVTNVPSGWTSARGDANDPGFEDSVLGHGGFISPGSINTSNHSFASTRALIAIGQFRGYAAGTSVLSLATPANANVIWYDTNRYVARPADVVNLTGGATVTVVPEPAMIVTFAAFAGGILSVRRRRAS